MHEVAEKRFNWALYENLRKIERRKVFRLLKWAVDSLPPPWDSGWKGVGRKPYDARALTVLTVWQEIEGKPERAFTADLERKRGYLRMLGLKHAPHRTALYRTRKRLSEEYLRQLNQKVIEGLKTPMRVSADATGMRHQGETALGLQQARMAKEDTLSSTPSSTLKQEPLRLSMQRGNRA